MRGMVLKPFFIILFVVFSLPAAAQSFSISHSGSPYELSLMKEGVIVTSIASITYIRRFLIEDIEPLTDSDLAGLSRNDVNPIDRPATYNLSDKADKASDDIKNALLVSPVLFTLWQETRCDLLTVAILYAESYYLTTNVTELLKSSTARKRPYVYNPDVPAEDKKTVSAQKSFPSGHVSSSFMAAVFFSTVFTDYYPTSKFKYLVWVTSLATATLVGYFRFEAGKHYPTDVLAGAVVGSSIGFGIPFVHGKRREEVAFAPLIGPEYRGGAGLAASYAF